MKRGMSVPQLALSPSSTFLSRRKLLVKDVAHHCSGAESGGVIETAKEKNGNSKMEIVSSEMAKPGDPVALSET